MTKPIRILQMPVANARGGVTQYILNHLRHIDRERFRFDFVTRSPTLEFAPDLRTFGSKIFHLTCSSVENEKQFIKEMRAILDEGYDAIHLHTVSWTGLWAEKLAMEYKVPQVIVHSHNTMVDVLDPALRSTAIREHERIKQEFTEDMATCLCACSLLAADWLFKPDIPRDRINILKNAVDTEKFTFDPEKRHRIRKRLGVEGNFVLGHVGRFTYQKNHALLLRIFQQIQRNIPHAKLLLIGDGPLLAETRQLVGDLELDASVCFLGRTDDVPGIMQAMDVYLQPSRFEGLPLVLVEAQSMGLPCLSSDTITKEVEITENIRFLSSDADAWVEPVLEWAKGYERRDNSRAVTQAGYSLREQTTVLEQLYKGEPV